MTTHDQRIDTTTTMPPGEAMPTTGPTTGPTTRADPTMADPAMRETDPSQAGVTTAAPEPMPEQAPEPMAEPTPVGTNPSAEVTETPAEVSETRTEVTLFADNDLSALRVRWDDVQSAFVDDPRDCVQKADALVSDVVEQLTAGFADARSGLEAQWSRGEQASTEDLRLALKRYREFFERLLAV